MSGTSFSLTFDFLDSSPLVLLLCLTIYLLNQYAFPKSNSLRYYLEVLLWALFPLLQGSLKHFVVFLKCSFYHLHHFDKQSIQLEHHSHFYYILLLLCNNGLDLFLNFGILTVL